MARESKIELENYWAAGEDRTLRFTVYDGPTNDTVVDVTGYSLEWVIRENDGNGTVLLTKAVGTGITITDGPNGIIDVAIDDDETVSLVEGVYFYTLRRNEPGNEVVLAYGTAILQIPATR